MSESLKLIYPYRNATVSASEDLVLPSRESLKLARSKLLTTLPPSGLGTEAVQRHLETDIVPGLNRSSQSSKYYGFVTGGATPIASFADNLVTKHDQSVSIHLPNETIGTDVEDAALRQLCELVDLKPDDWPHRLFTTGATASNVVGLTCAREYVVAKVAKRGNVTPGGSVSEYGIHVAMTAAGLDQIQIVGTAPHSSLLKAASIVGLGRASFVNIGQVGNKLLPDLNALEAALKQPRTATIIAIACAEVDAGLFTTIASTMTQIRQLADQYGAWIHVDAAFGFIARILPEDNPAYAHLRAGVANLELVDSITGDGHKLLNVPYDCGFFFSRHMPLGQEVFQNPNAAYFSSVPAVPGEQVMVSPSSIGIENSRRFRALPVYASLAAYGREGYKEMLERQIGLARAIARVVLESEVFELLPVHLSVLSTEERLERVFMVVMFRAKDSAANETLTQRIKDTRKIYVSGTKWDSQPATRFAVANWQVDVEADLAVVKEVLGGVANLKSDVLPLR